MKRFLSCVALMALASYVSGEGKISDDKVILYERTGKFAKSEPLVKLYEMYTKSFKPGLHRDDYLNFRPSETDCNNYLSTLVDRDYEIEKLVDFIKFDACLGILYDEAPFEYKDKASLEELGNKTEFYAPYHETKIASFSPEARHCIGDLLSSAVSGYREFQGVLNDHFVQLFVQFGECTDRTMTEADMEDPYLKIIYDLVKKTAKKAVTATVQHIEDYTEEIYRSQLGQRAYDRMKSKFGSSSYRLDKRWPVDVARIFDITRADGEEVYVRSVHEKCKKFLEGEKFYKATGLTNPNEVARQESVNNFLDTVAKKATRYLVNKHNFEKLRTEPGDLYRTWTQELCAPFQYSDKAKSKDFALSFQRLIDLTAFKDLFGVDEKRMLAEVLVQGKRPSTIYLSLSICNILDYTRGYLNVDDISPAAKYKKGQLKYNVALKPNRKEMVRWPVLDYY